MYNKSCSVSEISKMLNKSVSAIYTKASDLGLKNRQLWAPQEIAILKNNYPFCTQSEILELLPNRTLDCIRTMAHSFNLRSKQWYQKHTSVDSYRDISHFIRCHNSTWRTSSMKNSNYKCVISGNRFDVVHHLKSFDDILAETITLYNVAIKSNIKEYSFEELNHILSCFIKQQKKYPLGVCLTSSLHKQFHNEYGYGHNTEEQFVKFKEKYSLLQNPVTTTVI